MSEIAKCYHSAPSKMSSEITELLIKDLADWHSGAWLLLIKTRVLAFTLSLNII